MFIHPECAGFLYKNVCLQQTTRIFSGSLKELMSSEAPRDCLPYTPKLAWQFDDHLAICTHFAPHANYASVNYSGQGGTCPATSTTGSTILSFEGKVALHVWANNNTFQWRATATGQCLFTSIPPPASRTAIYACAPSQRVLNAVGGVCMQMCVCACVRACVRACARVYQGRRHQILMGGGGAGHTGHTLIIYDFFS